MSLKCPNYKSKEYKELVLFLGSESLAYKAWMANGEEIPSIDQLKDPKYKDIIAEKKSAPRFQAVLDNLNQKKSNIEDLIAKAENSIKGRFVKKDELTEDKILYVRKRVSLLKKQLNFVEQQLADIVKYEAVEDIIDKGKQQLKDVKDRLNSKTIDENELLQLINTINLWKEAGNFSKGSHIFLTEEELGIASDEESKMYEIKQELGRLGLIAQDLEARWIDIRVNTINQIMKDKYGKDYKISVKDAIKDIGMMESLFLPISKSDNALVQAMYDWNAKASIETSKELDELIRVLDDVFKSVYKRFSKEQLYKMFSQTVSNDSDKLTGDMVHRFSQSFWDWRKGLNSRLSIEIEKAKLEKSEPDRNKKISEAYKKYNEDFSNGTIFLDPRKLFPDQNLGKTFSEKEIQAHKDEIIAQLGENGYNEMIERLSQKIETFKLNRSVQEKMLADEYGTDTADYMRELQEFDTENSPYEYAKYVQDGFKSTIGGQYLTPKSDSGILIPRREINGKKTGFYDNKFESIEADPELYKLYNTMIETIHEMNSYLPEDIQKELQVNTLAQVNKSVLELFSGMNFQQGLVGIWDSLKENLREGTGPTIESTEETDVYGNKISKINTSFIVQNRQEIDDYVDRQEARYFQENPQLKKGKVSAELRVLRKQWREDIKDIIAKRNSPDIEKSIKAFALAAIAYKHKSKIQDSMQLAYSFLNDAVEQSENISGENLRDQFGRLRKIDNKYPENFKKRLDFFMESYYGNKTQEVEAATNKKYYTQKEKEIKDELEKLIENETNPETKYELQKQLNNLGGYTTGGRWLDFLNQLTRIRTLAWNPLSAIGNASFGYVANSIEASDGRYINSNGLAKGYKEVLSNSHKVTSILNKYSVLQELQSEIYENRTNRATRGWLEPFALISKTEVLNQGSLAVGILDKIKVKIGDKEMSLYDAFDKEGNLPDNLEVIDGRSLNDIIILIKDRIVDSHGNYDKDRKIRANKYVLLRSLMVFRKWMIDSVHSRVASYSPENIYGREYKGRWRSYGTYFNQHGVGGILDLTMQLLKRLSFGMVKTNFDEKLNELDAANMRKNLQEIVLLLTITALSLMLKALLADDDDDDRAKFLAIFWLNQITRVQTDITFYVSPNQFKTLIKDPLPVYGFINDATKAVDASINLISGGNDSYKSGPNKDKSKAAVAWLKAIGGPASLPIRIKNYYSQEFDKSYSIVDNITSDEE